MGNLKLSEIWIYPIKSLGGIRLSSTRVMPKGLEFDRRWMLIDEQGTFITQRIIFKMALFKLSMADGGFNISFNKDTIFLPINAPASTNPINAVIWDDAVEVFEVLGDFSNWFSRHLNIKCRLVYFPEDNKRQVDMNYATKGDHVSLADAYPFLIIGKRSLDDLNSRLEQPVPMNRFRPNFVFSGDVPFEEDLWKNITIGRNRFKVAKPCARCVLTTVDQETGMKGIEPLATLATFRKFENKIYFGQNLLAIDYYEVNEGALITLD